jgi:hypothetical protein
MAAVFAVSEHFTVSPADVLKWSYPLFMDALERLAVVNEIEERLAVVNEIETRKAEAMESQTNG